MVDTGELRDSGRVVTEEQGRPDHGRRQIN
jgi:hypothetical protein